MSAIVSTKPLRQVSQVRELLVNAQARDQLAAVAAKHMNPERMMRVVANAIRTTPKLQQCEPMSFLGALMHCASMGLEPNTPLAHAYLIPFENKRKGVTEVQVIIGYKGLIDLARRSGQLASIHGDVVYDDDELWSHEYGSNQHLRHRPGPRKGNRLGAYCYVKLNLGDGITAEGHRFMTMDEIIEHRNRHSQGWKTAVRFNKTKDSPWFEGNPAFEAMAIKTAVRALANRGELPMTIEFMTAMQTDEAHADYRAFAMDPDTGVSTAEPEDEPEYIEGEAEAEPETASDPDPKPEKPKPTQKPAAAKSAPVERKAAQDKAPAAQEERPSRHRKEEANSDGQLPLGDGDGEPEVDAERWEALAEMIIAELDDSSVDDVEEMYGDQIDQMAATKGLEALAKRVKDAIEAKK